MQCQHHEAGHVPCAISWVNLPVFLVWIGGIMNAPFHDGDMRISLCRDWKLPEWPKVVILGYPGLRVNQLHLAWAYRSGTPRLESSARTEVCNWVGSTFLRCTRSITQYHKSLEPQPKSTQIPPRNRPCMVRKKSNCSRWPVYTDKQQERQGRLRSSLDGPLFSRLKSLQKLLHIR